MKTLSTLFLIILFLGGCLSASYGQSDSAMPVSSSTMMAGVAKINITPETPITMSGYGNRKEPFKGIRDSVYGTAVVFSDGTNQAVIITADLIGFSHQFSAEILTQIEKATGISQENILLTANHNHGGPSNRAYRDQASPEIEKYVADLQFKLIKIVQLALAQLQPVLLGGGMGKCNMNINRRARLADGSIWLGRNPDGPCDHDVAVIRVDDLNRNPIAILVNWPCHGTVSGQDNYEITGDWPGAAARFVEKAFGGKVVVPITAGASGDINPIYGPSNNLREIDAIGMLLGEEVERVARSIETFPSGSIDAIRQTVSAKGKKPLENRFPDQKPEPGEDVEIHLSALKIGNLVFAGISGELMTEIGMQIKAESPYSYTIVVTHCNGNSGYLCTDKAYPEGGYEAMVSRTMPGTASLISENLKMMIRSLK